MKAKSSKSGSPSEKQSSIMSDILVTFPGVKQDIWELKVVS